MLTWTATGQAWEDAGAGAGDITAVTTAADSGLEGGSTSGDVALALSFSGLPALTTLSGGDYFAITDISDSNTIKRKAIVDVGVYLVSGSTTLDHITNGLLEVAAGGVTARELADDTITEPKLAIGNTPNTDQILGWDGSGLSWLDAGVGTITGVTAGTGLDGGGTAGAVTLDIENLGVGTAQLANFGVTVGKLAITNTPTAGQVLSYAGPNMTWVDSTGTGDITAVGVGTGLSGGGTTGDVTIELDLIGLPVLTTVEANDRVMLLDSSDSNLPKEIATSTFVSEITQFLRLDVLTLEPLIAGGDAFVFADSSNSDAIRRVTWGGAIARAADQDTLVTSNAVMRIAMTVALTQTSLPMRP